MTTFFKINFRSKREHYNLLSFALIASFFFLNSFAHAQYAPNCPLQLPSNGLSVGTNQFLAFNDKIGFGVTPTSDLMIRSTGSGFDGSKGLRINGTDFASTGGYIVVNKNTGSNTSAVIQVVDNNGPAPLVIGGSAARGTGIYSASGNVFLVSGMTKISGQFSSGSANIPSTTTIDWDNGNSVTNDSDCSGAYNFVNMQTSTYTLVNTDPGTTQCNFSTSVTGASPATVTYKFYPDNGPRTASSYTVYNFSRGEGDVVYVRWASGY